VPGGTVSSVWLTVVYLPYLPLGLILAPSLQAERRTHLRLFTAPNVPLTTWLMRLSWAVGSYRRHLRALCEDEAYLRELHAA